MFGIPVLVQAPGPPVVIVGVGGGADKILVVAGARLGSTVRLGIEAEIDLGDRVEAALRDLIPGKGIAYHPAVPGQLPGQRVEKLDRAALVDQALGEIPLPLQGRGDPGRHGIAALAVARTLEIQEEESFIAPPIDLGDPDRSAQGKAEHVVMKHALGLSKVIRAPVVGVQLVVAEELVDRAVEIVGARARHQRDGAAGKPAVFS